MAVLFDSYQWCIVGANVHAIFMKCLMQCQSHIFIDLFNQLISMSFLIPLRAKQVGKFIEIRHKKISLTLGCTAILKPINPQLSQQPAMGFGRNFLKVRLGKKVSPKLYFSSDSAQ